MRQTFISQACQCALQNYSFAHARTPRPGVAANKQSKLVINLQRWANCSYWQTCGPSQLIKPQLKIGPLDVNKCCFLLPTRLPWEVNKCSLKANLALVESCTGARMRVCVCVSLCHAPLNVHMCGAVLSHLQRRWFITGKPQGQGPCQRLCCHGSEGWKQQISFQYRLQMLGHRLGCFLFLLVVSLCFCFMLSYFF